MVSVSVGDQAHSMFHYTPPTTALFSLFPWISQWKVSLLFFVHLNVWMFILTVSLCHAVYYNIIL